MMNDQKIATCMQNSPTNLHPAKFQEATKRPWYILHKFTTYLNCYFCIPIVKALSSYLVFFQMFVPSVVDIYLVMSAIAWAQTTVNATTCKSPKQDERGVALSP